MTGKSGNASSKTELLKINAKPTLIKAGPFSAWRLN